MSKCPHCKGELKIALTMAHDNDGFIIETPEQYAISAARNIEWRRVRDEIAKKKRELEVSIRKFEGFLKRWARSDVCDLFLGIVYLFTGILAVFYISRYMMEHYFIAFSMDVLNLKICTSLFVISMLVILSCSTVYIGRWRRRLKEKYMANLSGRFFDANPGAKNIQKEIEDFEKKYKTIL